MPYLSLVHAPRRTHVGNTVVPILMDHPRGYNLASVRCRASRTFDPCLSLCPFSDSIRSFALTFVDRLFVAPRVRWSSSPLDCCTCHVGDPTWQRQACDFRSTVRKGKNGQGKRWRRCDDRRCGPVCAVVACRVSMSASTSLDDVITVLRCCILRLASCIWRAKIGSRSVYYYSRCLFYDSPHAQLGSTRLDSRVALNIHHLMWYPSRYPLLNPISILCCNHTPF